MFVIVFECLNISFIFLISLLVSLCKLLICQHLQKCHFVLKYSGLFVDFVQVSYCCFFCLVLLGAQPHRCLFGFDIPKHSFFVCLFVCLLCNTSHQASTILLHFFLLIFSLQFLQIYIRFIYVCFYSKHLRCTYSTMR